MTTETITPNDDGIAGCDNYGGVFSRPLSDDLTQRQLDHIDTMLHEIKATLDQLAPLLPLIPRALALLDPGAAMRRTFRKGRANAVPFSPSAPVHVGEAPEDSGPVGA